MKTIISGIFASPETTAWMVILSAAIIIAVILFSKVIKIALKLAVIAVMALLIVYFLRQAGII